MSDTNTMGDLRREVANRLQDTLHEQLINTVQPVPPALPHMLGVTPLGEVVDPLQKDRSILSATHEFWDDYDGVKTNNQAEAEIISAINSLVESGHVKIEETPEGSDQYYVEVTVPQQRGDTASTESETEADTTTLPVNCPSCDRSATGELSLEMQNGAPRIIVTTTCHDCEETRSYATGLTELKSVDVSPTDEEQIIDLPDRFQ